MEGAVSISNICFVLFVVVSSIHVSFPYILNCFSFYSIFILIYVLESCRALSCYFSCNSCGDFFFLLGFLLLHIVCSGHFSVYWPWHVPFASPAFSCCSLRWRWYLVYIWCNVWFTLVMYCCNGFEAFSSRIITSSKILWGIGQTMSTGRLKVTVELGVVLPCLLLFGSFMTIKIHDWNMLGIRFNVQKLITHLHSDFSTTCTDDTLCYSW